MKILMQLAIILLICLLGEVLAALLPFPFPASVISMLLVLALLLWGPLKIYHIQKFCNSNYDLCRNLLDGYGCNEIRNSSKGAKPLWKI